MRFHWQNLNEKSGRTGFPYYGRCWFYPKNDHSRSCIGFEWNLWSRFCQLKLDIDDEGWTFGLALPPLAFWLSFEGFKFLEKISPKEQCQYQDRKFEIVRATETGISIHNWSIWIRPWSKMNSWSKSDKWWSKGFTFHILDFFLGRIHYSSREISSSPIAIPMPERTYYGTVTFSEGRRKRPRWFPFYSVTANVSMDDDPIPFPGKGENSWDCGEDALFSISLDAKNMEGAVAGTIESVMRSRRRYGGSVNWEPEKKAMVVEGNKEKVLGAKKRRIEI